MNERPYDIVLFGATGFVGRLIAAHLAEHAPAGIVIALAGRSETKLRRVRAQLPSQARDWPLVTADVEDGASLSAMVASTQVLATTVGPYLRYGLPLVKACADAGTSYLDLTGEVLFVRACADRFDESARASGARIVNSCGFDSIPSDLGVLLLAERVRADGSGELGETTLVVRSLRGGLSGGTIDSLRAQTEVTQRDRAQRRVVADPYGLSPDRGAEPRTDERDGFTVRHEPELGWTAPFVMATYNTRIVRRSNALRGWSYGRGLRYREVMGFGRGPLAPALAVAMTGALGVFATGMSWGPSRAVLDRFLPAPGSGPNARAREAGHFRLEIHTRTSTGARYRAVVAAQGDPGYAATAVMFGQAALALGASLDDDTSAAAGVLTPAVALGLPLVERLRGAGMTFEVTRL